MKRIAVSPSKEFGPCVKCPYGPVKAGWLARLLGCEEVPPDPNCSGPEYIFQSGSVDTDYEHAAYSMEIDKKAVCRRELTGDLLIKSALMEHRVRERAAQADAEVTRLWQQLSPEEQENLSW